MIHMHLLLEPRRLCEFSCQRKQAFVTYRDLSFRNPYCWWILIKVRDLKFLYLWPRGPLGPLGPPARAHGPPGRPARGPAPRPGAYQSPLGPSAARSLVLGPLVVRALLPRHATLVQEIIARDDSIEVLRSRLNVGRLIIMRPRIYLETMMMRLPLMLVSLTCVSMVCVTPPVEVSPKEARHTSMQTRAAACLLEWHNGIIMSLSRKADQTNDDAYYVY